MYLLQYDLLKEYYFIVFANKAFAGSVSTLCNPPLHS